MYLFCFSIDQGFKKWNSLYLCTIHKNSPKFLLYFHVHLNNRNGECLRYFPSKCTKKINILTNVLGLKTNYNLNNINFQEVKQSLCSISRDANQTSTSMIPYDDLWFPWIPRKCFVGKLLSLLYKMHHWRYSRLTPHQPSEPSLSLQRVFLGTQNL